MTNPPHTTARFPVVKGSISRNIQKRCHTEHLPFFVVLKQCSGDENPRAVRKTSVLKASLLLQRVFQLDHCIPCSASPDPNKLLQVNPEKNYVLVSLSASLLPPKTFGFENSYFIAGLELR